MPKTPKLHFHWCGFLYLHWGKIYIFFSQQFLLYRNCKNLANIHPANVVILVMLVGSCFCQVQLLVALLTRFQND